MASALPLPLSTSPQSTPFLSSSPPSRPSLALATTEANLVDLPSSSSPDSAGIASAGSSRSYSHARAHSMSDRLHSSAESPPPTTQAPELVRRHHTLSTSSRLVRLERSRVRVALHEVGLSDQDRDFYVPQSPIDGPMGAWSDLGHGATTTDAARRSSLSIVNGHMRTPSSGSGGWGGSESELDAYPPSTTFLPMSDSPASATFDLSPPSSAKKSSFVVLRGGKGDAALTERRIPREPLPSARPSGTRNVTPPKPALEHRNSLKPFLEADGETSGDTEEWERRLQDERDKEELEMQRVDEEQRSSPYHTPPLSHSASFHSRVGSPLHQPTHTPHLRSNTISHSHQYSIASVTSSDAWNDASLSDDASVVRRRQSLSFRQDAGDNSSDEGWAGHERGSVSEELLSHSLASPGNGFGHTRAGTGPPSLSLSHSNSFSSLHGGGNLSHSNSIGSSSHHSHGGALSPVGGFPRSPWSPTLEETKQLGMGTVVGTPPAMSSLSRGGSGSSRGSAARYSDDVGRLSEDFASFEVAAPVEPEAPKPPTTKPPSPPGLDIRAALQSNAANAAASNGSGDRPSNARLPPVRSMTTNTISPNRRLPPLMTNPDVLASLSAGKPAQGSQAPPQAHSFLSRQGPASAAAFVPPIGHSHGPSQPRGEFMPSIKEPSRGNFSAAPGGGGADWTLKKEMLIGGPKSAAPFSTAVGVNPLAEAWPAGGGFGVGLAMQQQQQIQLLQSQMQAALQAMDLMKAQGHAFPPGFSARSDTTPTARQFGGGGFSGGPPSAGITPTGPPPPTGATADSPIDVPSLIASKGYNPPTFDLRPPSARFFVIKSYTEEDVHKSLKYEIWASTDLGNKRLDRAFRESADKGPIYLFFSVNGSGHFAGMAQMLTPVDYAMSSNVWASDKWKGVLKVRWIYIKDVPLASLRHIRLSNTPENKPVTSSRDTQEVPYDAGLAVLGIIAGYNSRTSLLQDFAFYEAKGENSTTPAGDKPSAPHQPHYAARPTAQPQPQPQQQQQQQQQQQYHPQQHQHQQHQHHQVPEFMPLHGGLPYGGFHPDMSGLPPMQQPGSGRGRFFGGGGRGNGVPGTGY